MTHTEDDHPGHSENEKRVLDFIDFLIVPTIIFPAFMLITLALNLWDRLQGKR